MEGVFKNARRVFEAGLKKKATPYEWGKDVAPGVVAYLMPPQQSAEPYIEWVEYTLQAAANALLLGDFAVLSDETVREIRDMRAVCGTQASLTVPRLLLLTSP